MDRNVLRGLALTMVVVAGGAPPIQAQSGRLAVEAEAGVAIPVGQTEDYFQVGPTMGLRATFGLSDRLDLVGSLGLDKFGGDRWIGTPDFRAMRFEVGGEATIFEDDDGSETVRFSVLAAAGATRFISDTFTRLNDPPTTVAAIATWQPVIGSGKFTKTTVSGTGGLRLRIGDDSGLSGSLSFLAHWSPLKGGDTAILKDADTLRQLDPSGFLRSVISIPVTVSLRLPL